MSVIEELQEEVRRLKIELLKVYKERDALYVELNGLHAEEAEARRALGVGGRERRELCFDPNVRVMS